MNHNLMFLLLAIVWELCSSSPLNAQDSLTVICLSPRVGNLITVEERSYFQLFPGKGILDARIVQDSAGNLFTLLRVRENDSTQERRFPLSQRTFAEIGGRIMNFEEIGSQVDTSKNHKPVDRGEQSELEISLNSGATVRGTILFADIHGVAVKADSVRLLSLREIREIRFSSNFGTTMWSFARTGALLGILMYGLPSIGGSNVTSDGSIFIGMIFSGVGGAIGLIIDLISLPFHRGVMFVGQSTSTAGLAHTLQSTARYPNGTHELKLKLAAFEQE